MNILEAVDISIAGGMAVDYVRFFPLPCKIPVLVYGASCGAPPFFAISMLTSISTTFSNHFRTVTSLYTSSCTSPILSTTTGARALSDAVRPFERWE